MTTYRWKFLLLLCFCGSPFLSLKLELVPDPPLKSLIFGRVAANFLPEQKKASIHVQDEFLKNEIIVLQNQRHK